ncbi:hypothetical protein ATKI12_2950 [Kitasatospora sp. Ki12]
MSPGVSSAGLSLLHGRTHRVLIAYSSRAHRNLDLLPHREVPDWWHGARLPERCACCGGSPPRGAAAVA